MKRSGWLKSSVFLVTGLFLVQQVLSAAPMLEVMPARELPSFLNVEIPQKLAKVEEIYEAPPKVDPQLILHVQNAHGNYDAQRRIAELMRYLYDQYGFRLFFVEGAVDRIEPDVLRLFPHSAQNMKVADSLAREGKLTGAELFMIDAPADAEAVGVEQARLYRENYDAFKKVFEAREITEAFLKQVSMKLNAASAEKFSRELRSIIQEWEKFEEGHRDFLPYVKQLEQWAGQYLELDLRELFAQVAWPQLTRLLMLQSMEEDLDLEAGRRERDQVVTFLRRQGLSQELQDAVADIEERHIRMTRLDPRDNRRENLPRFLIERLMEQAGPHGFDFFDYPEFSIYAGYFVLKSELDSRSLFTEIEVLFDKLLDRLAENSDQKILLQLYRDYMTLKKLFSLDLTRDGWDDLLRRENAMELELISERLSRLQNGGMQGLVTPEIQDAFQSAKLFYRLARQRETVFYYMINQGMQMEAEAKSILLTGGFHTAGVFEKFREDEVNYGVLMPQVSGEINRDNYISAMLDADHSFFETQTIERAMLTMADPSVIGFDGLSFGMDVLLAGARENINWTRTGAVDRSLTTPALTAGADFYNYLQFIAAYNVSPAAKFRRIQLIAGTDAATGNPVAFVAFQGRLVSRNEHRLAVPTTVITNTEYLEDGTKVTRPVTVLAGEAAFVKPAEEISDEVAEDVLPPADQDVQPEMPADLIAQIPVNPAPEPIESTDRARLIAAQQDISVPEQNQGILAGQVFALLDLIDGAAELEATAADPESRARLLSLISTLVSQGYFEAGAGFETILSVYTRILELSQSLTPPLEVARQAWAESNQEFVSDLAGDVIVVTSTLLSQERQRDLGLQLFLNPNLRKKFVFTPPPDEKDEAVIASFNQTAENLVVNVRSEMRDLGISISNLEDRLQAVTAANPRMIDKRVREKVEEIRQQRGKLNAADYIILTENNLRGQLGFVTLQGAVVIASEDLTDAADQTTQLYVAGRAAQDVRANGQFNPSGRYMEALSLKQRDVQTLNGYEYSINQQGLRGLQAVMQKLMQDVLKTAALLQSA